jgi:GT2 family glycosyltransferase
MIYGMRLRKASIAHKGAATRFQPINFQMEFRYNAWSLCAQKACRKDKTVKQAFCGALFK